MKKLLFTISSLENSGGSERSLVYRVNYLVHNFNYNITIVTTLDGATGCYYEIDPKVKIVNIPINYIRSSNFNAILKIFFNNYSHEIKLIEFIEKNKFDICSSLGSETFLYRSNNNYIFTKIKEVRFTYKRFFPTFKISFYKLIWRFTRLLNSIFVLRKMDYVISLTEEDSHFWKLFHKKVYTMPNFIFLNSILPSNLNNNVVVAVGRLEKEKDFASLIKAFHLVNNVHRNWVLNIYGEGSLYNQLNDLIISLNLSKSVFLKGAVRDIFIKYQQSSIYVHTSFYEGFGNSILEAMAHALPIVAFKSVGGVKLLVSDSFNGFLIQNRDIIDLSNKIISLIEDSQLRKTMGHNSRIVAEDFKEENIMLQWHKFYQNI